MSRQTLLSLILVFSILLAVIAIYFANRPDEPPRGGDLVEVSDTPALPPTEAESELAESDLVDFARELIEAGPAGGVDSQLIYTGQDVIEVIGRDIQESNDGSLSVSGLEQLSFASGDYIKTDPSATLVYDVETGELTVTAETMELIKANADQ
ncbi:MAG: hypothetical protein AAF236_16120 [Verrucomicrobiota bacterium]